MVQSHLRNGKAFIRLFRHERAVPKAKQLMLLGPIDRIPETADPRVFNLSAEMGCQDRAVSKTFDISPNYA
jgi:hypothetical protein